MTSTNQKPSVLSELAELERQIASSKRLAWILVYAGAAAMIAGLVMLFCDKENLSFLGKLSYLGSYFQGAVGSLWALAGLMFIYAAFLGQKQQLLLQRQEMEGQETQFRLQQDSIKRQGFESAFFQMVNLHNQLVNELKYGQYAGKEYFRHLHSSYARDFDDFIIRKKLPLGGALQQPTAVDRSNIDWVVEFYEQTYRTNEPYLGPYFRNLYHIFKFVKSSEVKDKRQYTSLIRAQLSKLELFFLFYNCLCSYGQGFKPLVEEFGLLEHLDTKALLGETHKQFYNENAFK